MAEQTTQNEAKKTAASALQAHFATLMKLISPLTFAAELYSAKIIDQETMEKAGKDERDKSKRAFDVLSAVQKAVEVNPDVFEKFCEILDREGSTRSVSKQLRESYKTELGEDSSEPPTKKHKLSLSDTKGEAELPLTQHRQTTTEAQQKADLVSQEKGGTKVTLKQGMFAPYASERPKLLPGKLTRRDQETQTELHTADKATQTENKEKEAESKKSSLQSGELVLQSLIWKQGKLAPEPLHKGTAAVRGNKAYFIGADSSTIQEYDIQTEEWEGEIECEHEGPALVFIGDLLTAVGGHKKCTQESLFPRNVRTTVSILKQNVQFPRRPCDTNTYCMIERQVTDKVMSINLQKPDQRWREKYPRMLTKKVLPQAVYTGEYLIALGRTAEYGETHVVVEVMNTSPPYQWQKVKGLMQVQLSAFTYRSIVVCRDNLYLATDNSVAYACLKDVIQSCATVNNPVRKKVVWRETPYPKDLVLIQHTHLSPTHFVFTTLVALEDHLLCLSHEHRYKSEEQYITYYMAPFDKMENKSRLRLDIYDPQKGWTCLAMSDLENHKDFCDGIATALPAQGSQLAIVGGRQCKCYSYEISPHKNVYLARVDCKL